MKFSDQRVIIFAGHYGSGKTNLAVNCALALRLQADKVMIADLDIVNPYFRTKDSEDVLNKAGIRLICSDYANSNLDIPALPQEMYAVTDRKDYRFVLDVGGDDRGALALGRLSPALAAENDYDMIFVANFYRPLTRTPAEAVGVMREIEAACGLTFTAVINNSNLGAETTPETVLKTAERAEETASLAGVPLLGTAVREDLAEQMPGSADLFPIVLQKHL